MKKIFLTGGAGVLGKELIRQYGAATQDFIVVAVIRAKSLHHFEKRAQSLTEIFRSSCASKPSRTTHELIVLKGDIEQPFFGLSESEYRQHLIGCSHIVHAAAELRLNQKRTKAIEQTMASINEICLLIERSSSVGITPVLHYVSTVGVAGSGMAYLPERTLTEQRTFRNSYEESKALAENLLSERLLGRGKVVFHRPSMIVGRSSDGEASSYQIFYFLCELVAGVLTRGIIPASTPFRLDVVPVDYVASVIIASLDLNLPSGTVLHECSGPDAGVDLQSLSIITRSALRQAGQRVPSLSRWHYRIFGILLPFLKIGVGVREKKKLSVVPFFLAYLSQNQRFDCHQTRKLLASCNIQVPHPREYLERVVARYANTLSVQAAGRSDS